MKIVLLISILLSISVSSFSQEIVKDNGITKKILKEGQGEKAKIGQIVKIKLEGRFENGDVFESGVMSFEIGNKQMIPGFNEVLPTMKKGEKSIVTLPPDMAYGQKDVKEDGLIIIPANSTLIFEIFLIKIK